MSSKTQGFFCKNAAALVLAAAMAAFAAVSYSYSLSRLYEFKNSSLDLGAFMQVMRSIIDTGVPHTALVPGESGGNWLGFHFSPILYLIVPLYALAPGPQLLQAIQALCIGLAAWPLFASCRRLGASSTQALCFSLAYLVNPFVLNAGVWDFHEVSLAVPLFALGLWAITARRFAVLCAICLLLVMTKEHYGIAAIGFGFAWWRMHDDRRGLKLAVAGLVAFIVVIFIAMPAFRNGGAHIMLHAGDNALNRYQWLLNPASWPHMLPTLAWQDALYGLALFLPLCFLPFGAPFLILPALADLGVICLSEDIFYRSLFAYHSAAMMPLLLGAACAAFCRIQRRHPRITTPPAIVFGLCLLLGWVLAPLPLPGAVNVWEASVPVRQLSAPDAGSIQDIAALVPPEASLMAQANIGNWFAGHAKLTAFPYGAEQADYALFKLGMPFIKHVEVLGIPYTVPAQRYRTTLAAMLASPRWGIVYWQNGWLLLKRGSAEREAARAEVLKALHDLNVRQEALEASDTNH